MEQIKELIKSNLILVLNDKISTEDNPYKVEAFKEAKELIEIILGKKP